MKKLLLLFSVLFVLNETFCQEQVVISEIFYDSPYNEQIGIGGTYSNGEYLEFYNLSNMDVDLSGWQLEGGGTTETYNFPSNTLLKANGICLVAYKYSGANFDLAELFPNVATPGENNLILYQNKIILSNSGELIVLRNAQGVLMDSLYYDGTSHISRPDRLSAENADGIPGDQCKSIVRKRVMINAAGYANCGRGYFGTGMASPFSVDISVSRQSGIVYTYDNAGNRIRRKYKEVSLRRSASNVEQNSTAVSETDELARNKIILYPNPTRGELSINIEGLITESGGNITLFDFHGSVLLKTSIDSNSISLDLSSYPNGIYPMIIEIDGQKSVWKIIKE